VGNCYFYDSLNDSYSSLFLTLRDKKSYIYKFLFYQWGLLSMELQRMRQGSLSDNRMGFPGYWNVGNIECADDNQYFLAQYLVNLHPYPDHWFWN